MEDADLSIRLHTGDIAPSPGSTPASRHPSIAPLSHGPAIRGNIDRAVLRCKDTEHVAPLPSLAPVPSGISSHAFAHSTTGSGIARESDQNFRNAQNRCVGGQHRRRRIRHVLYRSNVTSGRRMAHWGPFKTTFLHFKFGLMWYFGCSAEQLQEAYEKLYTDAYR